MPDTVENAAGLADELMTAGEDIAGMTATTEVARPRARAGMDMRMSKFSGAPNCDWWFRPEDGQFVPCANRTKSRQVRTPDSPDTAGRMSRGIYPERMPQGPEGAQRPASLVELRVLDGANLHFRRPAVAVTVDVTALVGDDGTRLRSLAEAAKVRTPRAGQPGSQIRQLATARILRGLMRHIAAELGIARLSVVTRIRPDGSITVAYPWRHRGTATAAGVALARAVASPASLEDAVAEAAIAPPGDAPVLPRALVPVVAVTGTNGKTTTSRLIAHMGRMEGRKVAWSSTDGIYVDGVCVDEGDWSGFGGAARVLSEPGLGLAVLESARGGLLLRGFGARHADVAVVTNVAADHLGQQGVSNLDELAEVKSIVARAVRTGGTQVLNAEDPRVLAMRDPGRAEIFVFALDSSAPGVRRALDDGGRAAVVIDDAISVMTADGGVDVLAAVVDVPATVGGLAVHNTANALAAAAAGLAIGLDRQSVVQGLLTFQPDPVDSPGRLNIYRRDGVTVVLDLAHNEDGLRALLHVADGLRGQGAQLHTILGTAGDRTDEVLRSLGAIAAGASNTVVIAQKTRYLRGRDAGEMVGLLMEGLAAGGMGGAPVYADELSALKAAVGGARAGDVVAFMCHVERVEADEWLTKSGDEK